MKVELYNRLFGEQASRRSVLKGAAATAAGLGAASALGFPAPARADEALRHKAAWSAAAHLGGKDLAIWTAAYPSG